MPDARASSKPSSTWSRIMHVIAVALGIYVFGSAYLFFAQENLLFFPQRISVERLESVKKEFPEAEELNLTSSDGIGIHGWFVKNSENSVAPAIIYFGGNAEEVSWMIPELKKFKGRSFAAFNYRGYGLSRGTPGEKEIFEDSLIIYDYVSSRKDVRKDDISTVGRSMGSAAAVYLAENRPVKKTLLVGPPDSIENIAKEMFPYVAVSIIIKHPFDSLSRAPNIHTPALFVIAEKDSIVKPEHSLRLALAWGGEKDVLIIEGKDHNNVVVDDYLARGTEFFEE